MSNHTIRKVNSHNWAEFGKLKSVEIEEKYLVITNEDGEVRRKSKVYASWTSSKEKLERMRGQSIITCAPADRPFSCLEWFSDAILNESYTSYRETENGIEEIPHRLLHAPKAANEETRQLLWSARIQKQFAVENAERLARYNINLLEQMNQELEEENSMLSKKDKASLERHAQEVREAVPKWLEADEMRFFRIVGDRGRDNSKLLHFDKEIAMRYRIDTTKISKVQIAVREYLDKNFILGDIIDPNGVGIRSLPQPIKLAVFRLPDENAWGVKTVRPYYKAKTWYRLERNFLGDRKDVKEPLDFWFGIYDKVLKEIDT